MFLVCVYFDTVCPVVSLISLLDWFPKYSVSDYFYAKLRFDTHSVFNINILKTTIFIFAISKLIFHFLLQKNWYVFYTEGNTLMVSLHACQVSASVHNYTDFKFLVDKILPNSSKQDTDFTEALLAKYRLAITIRLLSSAASFRNLHCLFKVSTLFLYLWFTCLGFQIQGFLLVIF